MKLKIFRGIFGKRKQLEQELQETKDTLKQIIENFANEIKGYNDKCWNMLCEVSKAREERDKALKKIEKLEEKLKELQSDRYLVRKVPTGRKPKGQTMKVKGSNVNSKIIKKIKEGK
jgi:uncharacterized coiled-coil DUF342 family protein